MEHEDEKINLKDVKEFSKSAEFRKELSNWIETKGISKQLQSRLRKDLIENFNRTTLGQQMSFEFQADHRMILSPLILALNTLVAEFLYAQNCHYTLSVFSTEVPYKNTMPSFEKREHFRFNSTELLEIYEAIGIDKNFETIDQISKLYIANNPKVGSNSLLYCFIKLLLKSSSDNQPKVKNEKEIPSSTVQTLKCLNCLTLENENKNKNDNNATLNTKNMKYLNKYLDSLTKRIKDMSLDIPKTHGYENKSQNIERLELINKSLDKITEEVKLIDKSNKHGCRILEIVKSINKLTLKFESCAKSIETLIKIEENKVKNQGKVQTEKKREKEKEVELENEGIHLTKKNLLSYQQWVSQLKESNNGQKFLKKLESSLFKTLEQEKNNMEKSFKENLEKERNFMKLHYRQKYLEQISSRAENIDVKESSNLQREFKELIEDKFKWLAEDRERREIDLTSMIRKNTIKDDDIRKNPVVENTKKIASVPEFRSNINKLSKHVVVDINIQPEVPAKQIIPVVTVERIPKEKKEHNVDSIVLDARKRLRHLENESEQLDQSFQNYLQRQNSEKSKLKMDVTKIWENYNFGSKVLKKKVQPSMRQVDHNFRNVTIENINEITTKQTDHKKLMELTKNLTEDLDVQFCNPFKNFDTQTYLLETRPEKKSFETIKTSFDLDLDLNLEEIRKKYLPIKNKKKNSISNEVNLNLIPKETNLVNIPNPIREPKKISKDNQMKELIEDDKIKEDLSILKCSHEKDEEPKNVTDLKIELNETKISSAQSFLSSEIFINDISLEGIPLSDSHSPLHHREQILNESSQNEKIEEEIVEKSTEFKSSKNYGYKEDLKILPDNDDDDDEHIISTGTKSKSSEDFWN